MRPHRTASPRSQLRRTTFMQSRRARRRIGRSNQLAPLRAISSDFIWLLEKAVPRGRAFLLPTTSQIVPRWSNGAYRRNANSLRPSHPFGLQKVQEGPQSRSSTGTNRAISSSSTRRPHHGVADGDVVRFRHARTRRRGGWMVQPAPALGELWHALSRLTNVPDTRHRVEPVVSSSPTSDRGPDSQIECGGRDCFIEH